MAALIGLVVGALVGEAVFGRWGATLFALLGFVAGVMWTSRRERAAHRRPEGAAALPVDSVGERIAGLELRVGELERALRAHGIALPPGAEATAPSPAPPATMHEVPAVPTAVVPVPTAQAATPAPSPAAAAPVAAFATAADGTLQPAAAEGSDGEGAPPPALPFEPVPVNPVWAWIVGGNTLARLGVLLLFIGVGFLLKYAAEHVQVPISVRLAGVAAGGIALLVAGWRLRHARRAYAMALQGGGVGILYLTAFAALRLYALLPPVAAFALMVWLCATSSWLAVRQDAIALAALAVLGGFLAPILTSSQSGSHVMLFSYYALLNAGILGIAWFKAWRSLNLLGFAFTFVVATFWGVTRYRPEHFATTEPFLVLFFLFYVAVAVLYAWRRSVTLSDYVDAGLVFGTPLVVAGLQAALVRDIE